MRYVERRDGREVRVVNVVRCVEVPVSSAMMIFDESTPPIGSALIRMGSNGGGIGAEVILAGRRGTGGEYSKCPEDCFFKEGRRVAEVEATGASGGKRVGAGGTSASPTKENSSTCCSSGRGGRSGLSGELLGRSC